MDYSRPVVSKSLGALASVEWDASPADCRQRGLGEGPVDTIGISAATLYDPWSTLSPHHIAVTHEPGSLHSF